MTKKQNNKKKEKTNLDELDIDELLPETIATSRLGRALASLGAILTGREKHDAKLVYLLLQAGMNYSEKLPITAEKVVIPETKKYSPAQVIEWFTENYPKQAQPILRKMEEEYTEPKTVLNYGLKEKRDLQDEFYIETLSKVLNISQDRATIFYHGIIKPHLEKEKEESRLVSLAMKDNK